jgi:hypothetical protein
MKKYFIKTLKTVVEIRLVNFDAALRAFSPVPFRGRADLTVFMLEDRSGLVIKRLREKAHTESITGNLEGEYYILFIPEKKRVFCFFEKGMQLELLVSKAVNLSFLVFQNALDIIFLHSASIVMEDKARLFIAPSGGGKSTFCSLAQEEGLGVLDDEVCVVKRHMNKFYASSFPCLMPFHFQPVQVEISGVFFLNKAGESSARDIPVIEAMKRALPEATCFFQNKIPAMEKTEYRKHIFRFLSSMFDSLGSKSLDFKKDRDVFLCVK